MSTGGFGTTDVVSNDGQEYDQVVVDTEPTELFGPEETTSVLIRALEANTAPIYIGWDDGVTDTTGFPFPAGEGISIGIDTSQQNIWAVADSGTQGAAILTLR